MPALAKSSLLLHSIKNKVASLRASVRLDLSYYVTNFNVVFINRQIHSRERFNYVLYYICPRRVGSLYIILQYVFTELLLNGSTDFKQTAVCLWMVQIHGSFLCTYRKDRATSIVVKLSIHNINCVQFITRNSKYYHN